LGYGTLEAGVKQLPFAMVMMIVAPNSPKIAARLGANVAVAIGLIGVSAGMFLFTIARVDTPYWQLVLVVMVMAAGMAMCIPTMTGSIMSAVPMGKAGVGSAMNDTTRSWWCTCVAVLGSLVASRYDTKLAPHSTCCPSRCTVRPARASPVTARRQRSRWFDRRRVASIAEKRSSRGCTSRNHRRMCRCSQPHRVPQAPRAIPTPTVQPRDKGIS
jgi:hypothetical protein